MFHSLGRKDVLPHPPLGLRLMGIGSYSTERHGDLLRSPVLSGTSCLAGLGGHGADLQSTCDILVNGDCIFSCPLLKWEHIWNHRSNLHISPQEE